MATETAETRAAVERLRRWRSGADWNAVYPGEHQGAWKRWTQDQHDIVGLYLAEHPADDAELVTEEWMRSVGFYEDHTGCWLITEDDIGWLLAWNIDEDGHSGAGQWSFRGDDMPESCTINTRGDVRRLCAALGIPLTPTS